MFEWTYKKDWMSFFLKMFSFRVDGSDHSDPWILARHPSLENVIKKRLAAHAAAGKVTDRLSATAK